MSKIRLVIAGLSYSQTQSGAYALVLTEDGGKRRLPIIIGGYEAQAIAIELENMVPTRPLTHDLFKTFADTFEVNVVEILIYNLQEGIFYSKIVCEQLGHSYEIDARTSDAIAIGVRFKAPIYTTSSILDSAGVLLDEDLLESLDEEAPKQVDEAAAPTNNPYANVSMEELERKLDEAVQNEEYELASIIRDELNRRK